MPLSATISDSAAMPIAMPIGQGAGLIVDRNGRLHSGDQPFAGGKAITPNDGADITVPHRCLWAGVGGAISAVVLDADGLTRNTISTTVGDASVFPFHLLRLNATGTTASGLVLGW